MIAKYSTYISKKSKDILRNFVCECSVFLQFFETVNKKKPGNTGVGRADL